MLAGVTGKHSPKRASLGRAGVRPEKKVISIGSLPDYVLEIDAAVRRHDEARHVLAHRDVDRRMRHGDPGPFALEDLLGLLVQGLALLRVGRGAGLVDQLLEVL